MASQLLTIIFYTVTGAKNFDAVDRQSSIPFSAFPLFHVTTPVAGTTTHHLPISETTQQVSGALIKSFQYDYYYRIHINPAIISLGNVLSRQTREIEVWNAYTESRVLTSISESSADGVKLNQPDSTPLPFNALQAFTYSVQIAVNGPPVINAAYLFNFTSERLVLTITGRRVVVWPYVPQQSFREVLEWKTDVLPAYKQEQRLALRQAPRQTLMYDYQLTPSQFSQAKAIASQWSHRVYGVPVWAELTQYGPIAGNPSTLSFDTRYADYREEDVLLVWDNDKHYEAVEMTTKTDSMVNLKHPLAKDYTHAFVMPLRFGRTPNGVSFQRTAFDIIGVDIDFLITDSVDLSDDSSPFTLYRGYDVLEDRPVLMGSLSESIIREVNTMDNQRAHLVVDPASDMAQQRQAVSWSMSSTQERWHVRQWLHSRKGRQKAFWLPSWNDDLSLIEGIGQTSTAMTVENIGYSLYYSVKDIMILLKDGTVFYRRTLGGSEDANGNEIISFDDPLGVIVTPSAIDKISFMSFVRFHSDRIEISHTVGKNADIRVPTIQVQEQTS